MKIWIKKAVDDYEYKFMIESENEMIQFTNEETCDFVLNSLRQREDNLDLIDTSSEGLRRNLYSINHDSWLKKDDLLR